MLASWEASAISEVIDNIAASRFELVENDLTAFANYRRDGSVLSIPHVEAPPQLRGRGTASRLMTGVVSLARREGLKIVPLCSYASAWFRRHSDARDVLG